MIKTASWYTRLAPDHIRVGISRGTPRGLPAGYRLYRKLAPGPWFNSTDNATFTELYQDILDRLDPRQVRDDLLRIADGRIPVLCCFERVGGPDWCHRALAARWLSEALAVAVPEIGFEDLRQAEHPLRPPETLLFRPYDN